MTLELINNKLMHKADVIIWFRWFLLLMWVPLALMAGIFLSLAVSDLINVWEDYIGAVILPILGIIGSYFIAPRYKYYSCILIYLIGLFITFNNFTPSWYSEMHPLAYQKTYIPFVITTLSGIICLLLLVWWMKSKPRSKNV